VRFVSSSLADTQRFGEALGKLAEPGDVFCLLGDLGAGKTSLTQGIGKGLDIKQHINSPTFNLINEYQGRIPLYHMDLYRMEAEEGEELGLKEYFWGKGLCVVEWPQVAAEILPQDILQIDIISHGGWREIKLTAHGSRSREMIEEVKKLVDLEY
jgi:tRNA threonylcarbamoyladenosine biosynthesis protein TsaE